MTNDEETELTAPTRPPAPRWWVVRMTPYDKPDTKFYGPFKARRYADSLALAFDNTLCDIEVIELVRSPNPHRLEPYMRGYRPPTTKPQQPQQPEPVLLEEETET